MAAPFAAVAVRTSSLLLLVAAPSNVLARLNVELVMRSEVRRVEMSVNASFCSLAVSMRSCRSVLGRSSSFINWSMMSALLMPLTRPTLLVMRPMTR